MMYKYTLNNFYTLVLKKKDVLKAAKSNKKNVSKLKQWTKTEKADFLLFIKMEQYISLLYVNELQLLYFVD